MTELNAALSLTIMVMVVALRREWPQVKSYIFIYFVSMLCMLSGGTQRCPFSIQGLEIIIFINEKVCKDGCLFHYHAKAKTTEYLDETLQ